MTLRVVEPGARVLPLRQRDDVSDAELVLPAREGDRAAEDVLVRRHFPAILSMAGRLLGDREEARDVAQDTFAVALSKLASLREPAAFSSWALQIAVRQVHRRFRRKRLLRWLGFVAHEPDAALDDLADESASPRRAPSW